MTKINSKKKYLFISEALSAPFDEGIKNVALSLHEQLGARMESISVTKEDNCTNDLKVEKVGLNKLFLNVRLKNLIKNCAPDIIIYLPEASVTFNSFIRAKILKLMRWNSIVVLLGVKHIAYSHIQRKVIEDFLVPDYLMLLGRFEMDYYLGAGMNVKVLPPSVDSTRFFPASDDEKRAIRVEFNIPDDKTVVLHVGHIRTSRNVESLLEAQKIEGVQVVIVGSTSTDVEDGLKDRLVNKDVLIINRAVSDISKIYRMSDIYVFPVFNRIACIDMPLSVLEAMACNLPVVTTRFGGLTEHFKEDEGFKYVDTIDELTDFVRSIKDTDRKAVRNSEKVKPFTWSRFTDEIINTCEDYLV